MLDRLLQSRKPVIALPLIVGAIVFFPLSASAQIIPDTTLGTESSVVTPIDANFERIDGGATRGVNLFHSFQEFNIDRGASAYFSNPAGIINILSRVTGKNPSQLLGTLGVLGNANLFFLNPNGIIFGPNSRLDISGSFVGSTGSGFILPDGTEYSATNPQAPPLLTVTATAPIGLKLEGQPGMITTKGNLTVGQDLTLFGGNLNVRGQLLAGQNLTLQGTNILTNGQLVSGGNFQVKQLDGNLGNIFSPAGTIIQSGGDVALNSYLGGSLHILAGGKVEIPNSVIIQGTNPNGIVGQVTLSDGTIVSVDGQNQPTLDIRAGTDINVDSIRIFLFDAGNTKVPNPITGNVLLTNQFQPNADLVGNIEITNILIRGVKGGGLVAVDSKGNITVNGIVNVSAIDLSPPLDMPPNTFLGNGGDVNLLTNNDIIFAPGSGILSDGLLGGQIILKSGNLIFLDGGRINSNSHTTQPDLHSGDINLVARSISMTKGAQIETNTVHAGEGGNIDVNASEFIQVNGIGISRDNRAIVIGNISTEARPGSTGKAGNLTINTQQLLVKEGAGVGSISFGAGDAGNVNVTASELIQVIGISAEAQTPSVIGTVSLGTGNAGDLTIITRNLQIQNGAGVSTNTFGAGKGGQLTITALQSIQLLGITGNEEFPGGLFTSTVGIGKAGDLIIITDQLIVKNRAQINTSTFDPKNENILAISAIKFIQQLLESKEMVDSLLSQIESIESTEGAGNIRITTNNLRISDGGQISATTARNGTGGNIILQVNNILELRNQGQISTTAGLEGQGGDGGNINIRANFIFAHPTENSDITANTFTGNGGKIQIFTQGIFGIEPRPTPSLLSDITASSELGVDGTIEINRLNTDPIGGLIDLPETPTEVRVAQGCQTEGEESVAFFKVGRGGLLPKPEDFLSSETIIAPWIPLVTEGNNAYFSPETMKLSLQTLPITQMCQR